MVSVKNLAVFLIAASFAVVPLFSFAQPLPGDEGFVSIPEPIVIPIDPELEGLGILGAGGDTIGAASARATYGVDGTGYAVAVLDTGVNYNHSDFGGRVVAQYDFVNEDSDAMDDHGHGSHVAGTIASENPSYLGVAPNANIVALKVLAANGSGSFGDVEEALQWVIANRETYNIVAVNMSLGAGNFSSSSAVSSGNGALLNDEISSLVSAGVFVAASSGNSYFSYGAQGIGSPAVLDSVVSVGALWDNSYSGPIGWSDGAVDYSTALNRVTSFTQRSSGLTILAPGAFITSTDYDGTSVAMGGTSMASPVVAGAALLMHEYMDDVGLSAQANQTFILNYMLAAGNTINDGDDEDDNVTNTGLNFTGLDLSSAMAAVPAGSGSPSPSASPSPSPSVSPSPTASPGSSVVPSVSPSPSPSPEEDLDRDLPEASPSPAPSTAEGLLELLEETQDALSLVDSQETDAVARQDAADEIQSYVDRLESALANEDLALNRRSERTVRRAITRLSRMIGFLGQDLGGLRPRQQRRNLRRVRSMQRSANRLLNKAIRFVGRLV